METVTLVLIACASIAFIAAGLYLHFLRKKSEAVYPAPFVNPPGKRKPARKRSR